VNGSSPTPRRKKKSALEASGSLRLSLAITIGALAFLPSLTVLFAVGYIAPEVWGKLGWPVLGWMSVALFVSAGIGYWVARRILLPLERLERDMRYLRVSRRSIGDLYLPPADRAEPLEVATVRRRFEEVLEHLRQAAEEREAFYAMLAHDLKTPILAAGRATQYLREAHDIGRENRLMLLRQLEGELERVYRLLENLLTASRIENVRPKARVENLRELAERLRLRHLPQASDRGVAIRVQGHGFAKIDRDMIERAIDNLLDNAIRHARKSITIHVGDGWIEVADDGPGLPAPLEELARPFRSQRRYEVRSGSAGLGLYIARRIAEIHHGRLTATGNGGARLRLEVNYDPKTVYETMETIW